MVASGVISLRATPMTCTNGAPTRSTDSPGRVHLPLEGESEADYRAPFADCQINRKAIQKRHGVKKNVHVIAYPSGRYNSLAQVTCWKTALTSPSTTEGGHNTSSRGSPSLCGHARYNMNVCLVVR